MYSIVFLALLLRQPLILHGIHIAVIWFMLRQMMTWVTFITENQETREAVRHLRWLMRYSFQNVQKAAEGDSFRGFILTKTANFWTVGAGKGFVKSFLRDQGREIRQRNLKEAKEALANATRSLFTGEFRGSPGR